MIKNKAQFVEDLSNTLKPYLENIGFECLTYRQPGLYYTEEVVIHHISGVEERVNVTWEDPLGILKAICKQGF